MTTETEKGFENARNLRKKVFWETDNYAQLFIHSLKSRENCRKPEIEKEARGLKAPRKKSRILWPQIAEIPHRDHKARAPILSV